MKQIRNTLDKILEVLCSVVLVIMIVVVLYQVFSRTVLGQPNTVSEELVRFGIVWLSMLASAYVVGKGSHLSVSLLSDHLDEKKKKLLFVVIQVLFMLFSAVVMFFGGVKAVSVTIGQISPSLGWSMGIVYAAVPVSGVLMFIYSLLNLIDGPKLEEQEEK